MKKLLFLLAILLISCNSSSEKKDKQEKKEELVMYNPSELTLLMEEIYAKNEKLKQEIIDGKITSNFSNDFLKIHSATMTDRFERDKTFEIIAENFIKSQELIYSSKSDNAKENFNNTINLCVACHQNTCTGPIPRIKKLLIK